MKKFWQIRWHRVIVAFQGIYQFFRQDFHGKLHAVIASLTCILGAYLGLEKVEWLLVILCIGIVISAEMLNSALEALSDVVQPQQDLQIKGIKDISAGAVLWVSLMSLVIGICIFVPKISHALGFTQ